MKRKEQRERQDHPEANYLEDVQNHQILEAYIRFRGIEIPVERRKRAIAKGLCDLNQIFKMAERGIFHQLPEGRPPEAIYSTRGEE